LVVWTVPGDSATMAAEISQRKTCNGFISPR
jgi:hypothetical protein